MSDVVDQEIEAIKTVLAALEPLPPEIRVIVLDYVLRRLGIDQTTLAQTGGPPPPAKILPPQIPTSQTSTPASTHIEDLSAQKKPASDIERAALVAYFLAEIAPEKDRKQSINSKDLKTYFKIAGFPLPANLRYTIANARNAGYFDSAGEGEFSLNAVGHNLVAHSMPRGSKPVKAKKRARKTSKKVTEKKVPKKKVAKKPEKAKTDKKKTQ